MFLKLVFFFLNLNFGFFFNLKLEFLFIAIEEARLEGKKLHRSLGASCRCFFFCFFHFLNVSIFFCTLFHIFQSNDYNIFVF